MRPLNLNNVTSSAEGGSYTSLKPGKYLCAITDAEDFESKEYVRVLLDIASGEFANFFSDDFYANKPWAHNMILSYKESALSMLKSRLETITKCNPGFDAVAALDAGKYQMLTGKAVGVVFRNEEYYDKTEDKFVVGSNPRPAFFCDLDEVGKWDGTEPKPGMLNERGYRSALTRAGIDPDEWLRKRNGDWHGEVVAVSGAYDDIEVPF